MNRTRWFATLSCVASLLAVAVLHGGEALRMEVSPAVSRAPAVLTIRVSVEPSSDNRTLQVIAESSTFYRSSEIEIDGVNATPLQIVEFRNLPAGVYHVTGVLVGAQGPRGKILRMAKVEPSPGSR